MRGESFGSKFKNFLHVITGKIAQKPLLSICIPAYNRPQMLNYALDRFISQIEGKYEECIEILITDDASPNDSLRPVRERVEKYDYIDYRRLEQNIGLERNLLESARRARGKYLWIFGDDDFLETDDALDIIISHLREGAQHAYIINKTRRSNDLKEVISKNWMELTDGDIEFSGLNEVCRTYGFIMVLGFVSANIFLRKPFCAIDAEKYLGTMYPQLGAMVEAFHDKPALLIAKPLVCHRTTTQDEKRRDVAHKNFPTGLPTEKDFMRGGRRKFAVYASHTLVRMLDELIDKGALRADEVHLLHERFIRNINLVQHLIDNVALSLEAADYFDEASWRRTKRFFDRIELNPQQRLQVDKTITAGLELCSPGTTVGATALP